MRHLLNNKGMIIGIASASISMIDCSFSNNFAGVSRILFLYFKSAIRPRRNDKQENVVYEYIFFCVSIVVANVVVPVVVVVRVLTPVSSEHILHKLIVSIPKCVMHSH
jgi:hypothetical protein